MSIQWRMKDHDYFFNFQRKWSLLNPLHKAALKYLPKQIIDTSVVRILRGVIEVCIELHIISILFVQENCP